MTITQISAFVENKAGKLAEVTETLGGHGIDIRALSIADTSDFGILRLIVDKPAEAVKCLTEAGFIISETDVIAVPIEDSCGGLGKILRIFADTDVSIEYCYAFVSRKENTAYVVFRVEDSRQAAKILDEHGIHQASPEDVYTL